MKFFSAANTKRSRSPPIFTSLLAHPTALCFTNARLFQTLKSCFYLLVCCVELSSYVGTVVPSVGVVVSGVGAVLIGRCSSLREIRESGRNVGWYVAHPLSGPLLVIVSHKMSTAVAIHYSGVLEYLIGCTSILSIYVVWLTLLTSLVIPFIFHFPQATS